MKKFEIGVVSDNARALQLRIFKTRSCNYDEYAIAWCRSAHRNGKEHWVPVEAVNYIDSREAVRVLLKNVPLFDIPEKAILEFSEFNSIISAALAVMED